MSSYNEWELLAIAEDIEQGDEVLVELENGEQTVMIFIKEKGRGTIELKDETGEKRYFSSSNLEEKNGYAFILGKA